MTYCRLDPGNYKLVKNLNFCEIGSIDSYGWKLRRGSQLHFIYVNHCTRECRLHQPDSSPVQWRRRWFLWFLPLFFLSHCSFPCDLIQLPGCLKNPSIKAPYEPDLADHAPNPFGAGLLPPTPCSSLLCWLVVLLKCCYYTNIFLVRC